jgi:uncharacterized protein (TIGR02453 family)
LALQQNREWFQKHRADYEALWAAPMRTLMESLRARIAPLYGKHALGPLKVFRLNRDVRFSKDKSPYKTNCGALLSFGRAQGPLGGPAAVYLHLGLDEVAASGFYALEPAALARYRKLLLEDKQGKVVAGLVQKAEARGQRLSSMESVKVAPRGVDPQHPRVALLRHKGFAMTFPKIPRSVRFSASLEDWLLEQCRVSAPLVTWGLKYVG